MQFCLDRTMSGKTGPGAESACSAGLAQDAQRSRLFLKVAAVFTHPEERERERVCVCVCRGGHRLMDRCVTEHMEQDGVSQMQSGSQTRIIMWQH